MKRAFVPVCAAICIALFAYTQYAIFYVTPLEQSATLLFNQKIFYYHVPCSFVLFISIFVCGISSIQYLRTRNSRHMDIADAAGTLAVVFGAAMLLTGSIWGKAAWGKWWQWDARLTTALMLWMIVVGYQIVRSYGEASSERLAAGLAIFGMANVPLVYFSVKIAKTIHPKAQVVATLDSTMRGTFWLSVLLFVLFYVLLMVVRVEAARAQRRLHEARERGLDAGLL